MDILDQKLAALKERFGVPGSVLKIIAIVTMLIDHTGAAVVRSLNQYPVFRDYATAKNISTLYYYMRRIGRLAFPIFCFLLVEGFFHTRSIKKYAQRLFLFALISEFPFDYALHHKDLMAALSSDSFLSAFKCVMNKQNVYWTLLIGLLVLWAIRVFSGCIPVQLALMAAGMMLARALHTDYSYHGVFFIELMYVLRSFPLLQGLCGASYMEWYEKMPTPLCFIPILLYNGKRGRQLKYLYYWFYPVHLIVLGLITYRVLPAVLG